MKIGEALNQRKYLMNHIPQIITKLQGCITVEQGAVVNGAESSAAELRSALDSESEELRQLIVRINRTNNSTRLACGLTIMEAIARREYLKGLQEAYAKVAPYIRPRVERQRFTSDSPTITYVVAEGIHPANFKQQMTAFAQEWRRLDNDLQQANWSVDLVGE